MPEPRPGTKKFVENEKKKSVDTGYVNRKWIKGAANAAPFCVEKSVEAVEVLGRKGLRKGSKNKG